MKKLKYLIIVIVLLIIVVPLTYYISLKSKIKKSYNEYVITNKQTTLYNSDYKEAGTLYQNTYLELDKPSKDKYFKIKDTDYYVYYKDISKTDKSTSSLKDYYLDLGTSIKTNEVTNLYQNDEIKIAINNSFDLNVKKSDDKYYYVTFGNEIFGVKKDDIREISDIEIGPSAQFISVINYENVLENCDKTECVTLENFKNQLNYLKENGYYTIDINDYKLWINNGINLKEKAIFITSKQENINEIAKEYNLTIEQNFDELTYTETNSKSEKGNNIVPRYNINNKTTLDIFKQITNGEFITYVEAKPLLQQHTLPNENTNASKIAVLNYHFFFDPEIGETCPDDNCKTVQDFEQELLFLKQNNYKTLTMDEFTKWMYNEIELPARSVLITIDDGAMGTGAHNGNKLIPLLEKYQTHATLFLITGWWAKTNYESPYLDIESHTHNMHEGNYCEGVARGSKLLCSTKQQVLEDFNTSIEITGSKNAFCFPMYVYNDITMQALKEVGFKLAFVGGDVKATRDDDKYKVPRYHIYRTTTLDQFVNMVS